MRKASILSAVLMLVLPAIAISQTDEDTPITVSTILANVPVIVSDRTGKHVAGLKAADFKISSGGNPKEIVYFSDSEMPLTVAIILDITGSVMGVLDGIKKGAKEYVNQLGPDDQCTIVTFGEKVKVREPFTSDKKRLLSEIKSIFGIQGGTALMDEAVLRVVQKEFAGIKGRKAIILLTDAGEINPHLTPNKQDRRGPEANVAHEGAHVRDFLGIIKGGYQSTMTHRQSEQRGYAVEESYVETHSTVNPVTGKSVPLQNPKIKGEKAVNAYLQANPTLYPNLDSPIVDKTRIPVRSKK